MYESPIKIITSELVADFERHILKAVQNVGIEVDKEELLRALEYDRKQYQIGFVDGREQIVHCEYCILKKAVPHKDGMIWRCPYSTVDVDLNGFCHRGVRMDVSDE